jgi:hypothetical protein
MNGPSKLDRNITLGWQYLKGTNTLVFRAYSQATKKMKCCEYDPWSQSLFNAQFNYWGCIHNTLFFSQLMNGAKKLERNITLGCQCLKGTNTLVFRAYSQVTKKMKCCEYDPWSQFLFNAQFNFLGHIHNTLFTSQLMTVLIRPNKLDCDITLCWQCLKGTIYLVYWANSQVMKKMKSCGYEHKCQQRLAPGFISNMFA